MGSADPKSSVHDLVSAAFGVIGAVLLISTRWEVDTSGPYPFYKGPLIFPLLVLSIIVLASLPSAWRLFKQTEKGSWRLDGHGAPKKPAALLLVMIFFILGIPVIGLELSSFLFMSIGFYYLGHRRPLLFLILPALCTALIVFVFKYALGVYFPTPLVLEWFGA
jgi:hypothetical protein